MKQTEEQKNIIAMSRKSKSLVVNALAGSGKTSTAIECVKANVGREKIGYFSFNKSVADTMKGKLDKARIQGPDITTLHALAFRNEAARSGRKIQTLKPYDIEPFLKNHFGMQKRSGMSRRLALTLARMDSWCHSSDTDIEKFLERPFPMEARESMRRGNIREEDINTAAKILWNEIIKSGSKLPLTHNVYLKQFHINLSKNPRLLNYTLAIVDEAQDLFPVTEAVVRVMRDNGTRVILFGDRYQQIYTWNGSVNSIQRFEPDSDVLSLTQSFRCPAHVVAEASKYLKLLGFKGEFRPAPANCELSHKSGLKISRTNTSLLANIVNQGLAPEDLHLVGGIDSYNFDPTRDYLNFVRGARDKVRSPIVSQLRDDYEYDEYVEETGDLELKQAKIVVKSLGPKKVWDILSAAGKKRFAENPQDAKLCLSTGHKAKGSEFERVEIDTSFVNITAMCKKQPASKERETVLTQAGAEAGAFVISAEELRLAYVALTRSTRDLEPGNLAIDNADMPVLMKMLADREIVLADLDENGNMAPYKP